MENKEIIEPILPEPGEEEIWKVCVDYPAYEVSSFGRVRNKKNQRILTQRTQTTNGYCLVHLRIGIENKNGKNVLVHRLVNIAFSGIEGKLEGKETDHIDRNRQNNYYKNLRWVSRQENQARRILNVPHRFSSLTTPIVQIDRNTGKVLRRFRNLRQASAELNLSISTIQSALRGYYQYSKWDFQVDKPQNKI